MSIELKATVVNMKTLTQEIEDPIVNGAADVKGRTLRIIFTQEAAAQITPKTKVYLSWWHQDKNIKGYNVFTEITDIDDEDFPPTWEIYFPQSMLWEGNVLANIQLVDDVSIAVSTNFIIHVLKDPNEDDHYIPSDDYSEFKAAVINLNSLSDRMEEQLEDDKAALDQIVEEFEEMKETIATEETVEEIRQIAEGAMSMVTEQQSQIDGLADDVEGLQSDFQDLWNQHVLDLTFYEFV